MENTQNVFFFGFLVGVLLCGILLAIKVDDFTVKSVEVHEDKAVICYKSGYRMDFVKKNCNVYERGNAND